MHRTGRRYNPHYRYTSIRGAYIYVYIFTYLYIYTLLHPNTLDYSISQLKTKALQRDFTKVRVAARVMSIQSTPLAMQLVLEEPTGSINATVPKELLVDPTLPIREGSETILDHARSLHLLKTRLDQLQSVQFPIRAWFRDLAFHAIVFELRKPLTSLARRAQLPGPSKRTSSLLPFHGLLSTTLSVSTPCFSRFSWIL